MVEGPMTRSSRDARGLSVVSRVCCEARTIGAATQSDALGRNIAVTFAVSGPLVRQRTDFCRPRGHCVGY
jgi:hypothetical protein